MRIAIITAFNKKYAPIADISLPLMKNYAEKHGYGLHVGLYHEDATMLEDYGDRKKIKMYNEFYAHYEAIMWLDIDALIMNSDITIEDKLGVWPFMWTYDVNGPCSGLWIARCQPMVRLALDAVALNAMSRGKVMTYEDHGPPHKVVLQMEPHGSSDQDEMRRLMHIPPYSSIFGYCISGKQAGHTYKYSRLGWGEYANLGDYAPGDWILTFPSEPLDQRIELLAAWAQDAR